MDSTSNDAPADFEVSGFPTLYFVPKDNTAMKYSGGRELDDFVTFLEDNSSAVKGAKKVEL